MKQYFKVGLKVERDVEDSKGRLKTKVVREEYLVDAVTPTEAEAKINKHLEGSMETFEVTTITLTKILEVV
ncbi:MAG: DUF4494 domain-containing protein [Chloroflexia bacterium]|nr:DUF4494 domain-containing protein [Chloroflexia bacterium]